MHKVACNKKYDRALTVLSRLNNCNKNLYASLFRKLTALNLFRLQYINGEIGLKPLLEIEETICLRDGSQALIQHAILATALAAVRYQTAFAISIDDFWSIILRGKLHSKNTCVHTELD